MVVKKLSSAETVEEVARGMALDLLEMLREADGLDYVTVTANSSQNLPSVRWMGMSGDHTVFSMHLVGKEVPL